jgi:hypothetical protein
MLMQVGHDVYVHGQVSPSLLRNLVEFQGAWASWKPNLHAVEVSADRETEAEIGGDRKRALVAFSGGVDSCFTAFRHVRGRGLQFPCSVAAGVMVHGFDIPLDEPETFACASERSRRMLASLGLDLVPIATNYREVVADWSHSFGAAVSSCLMLLGGGYSEGLVGQGLTYGEFSALWEGSNPLTDPLLSSATFRVVPDGAAFDRASKIDQMSGWSEFLHDLRVCWQGPRKHENCCACEKCIRNILTFRALGLGLPPCFPHDVEDATIRTFGLGGGALPEIRYGGLAALAASRGVAGEWIGLLEARLRSYRRLQRSRIARVLHNLPYYRRRLWGRFTGRG